MTEEKQVQHLSFEELLSLKTYSITTVCVKLFAEALEEPEEAVAKIIQEAALIYLNQFPEPTKKEISAYVLKKEQSHYEEYRNTKPIPRAEVAEEMAKMSPTFASVYLEKKYQESQRN